MGALVEQVKNLPEVQAEFEKVLVELNKNANDLLEQADRAVIASNDAYATGGDLVSIIRGQERKAEAQRTGVTGPINGLVKLINAGFAEGKKIRKEARDTVESKMLLWQRTQEKRLKELAAERARKLEEEALERAAMATDDKAADKVLEVAGEAAETQRKATTLGIQRGDYGASTSSKKVPVATITDLLAFLLAADKWQGTVHPGAIIDLKKSGLNSLAKAMIDNGLEFPGVEASLKDTLNIR